MPEANKDRIGLQFDDLRLQLMAAIEWKGLKQAQLISFVIDTGSPESFISQAEVEKLQIPTKNRPVEGEIDVGGSRFKKIDIQKITLHLLKEGSSAMLSLSTKLSALKTTKTSEHKKSIAHTLPSILGLDFLMTHNLSLHVFPKEKIAYLQTEE